jgi:hypothetical protein
MLVKRSFSIALLLSFALLVPRTGSSAPPQRIPNQGAKAACLAAHEEAQSLRTQKKLHAARAQYVLCAKTECPVVLRKECSEQIEHVDAVAPTVALEALDDKGMSDTNVKVTIDGKTVAEGLTGAALPIEPGDHSFRFERADGKALDLKVLIVEGEKNRKVTADFQTLVPKQSSPTQVPPPAPESKRVPVLAFVAGGVALAAAGGFAFFAITGKSKEKDLAGSCAPNCTSADVAPVERSYLVADVSLVVAVIAAGAAIVLALPALGSSGGNAASAKARPITGVTW